MKRIGLGLTLLISAACTNPSASYSLNEVNDLYVQQAVATQRKVDILWVIDNSNSMSTSQASVADNFDSFFSEFINRDYDFNLAVATTDSWLGLYDSDYEDDLLFDNDEKDILNSQTSDLETQFANLVKAGVDGYGDERAFQSMMGSLNLAANSGFIRDDAYLAIIIVSDEDDFSHDSETFLGNDYTDPDLIETSSYAEQLSTLKQGNENFSVSALTITDDACLSELQNEFPGRRIGQRYVELAEQTGGVTGSLCEDFSVAFNAITTTIVQLSNVFPLDREPVVETIEVYIDGEKIAEDGTNGWTYNSSEQALEFFGSAFPSDGAQVVVNFDPVSIKE